MFLIIAHKQLLFLLALYLASKFGTPPPGMIKPQDMQQLRQETLIEASYAPKNPTEE